MSSNLIDKEITGKEQIKVSIKRKKETQGSKEVE